ncbi:MAG: hypothetical protein ACOYM1_08080 [Methylovulum sp.]
MQNNDLSNEQQAAFLFSYLTVQQFCETYKAFKVGGVRSQIFNSSSNGLKQSGAIVRNGRKVLIKPSKYFEWIESQNKVA